MKIPELINKATSVYFAGFCNCGCGEACYDVDLNDGKVYPVVLGEKLIREIRPELLDKVNSYSGYGRVEVAE